ETDAHQLAAAEMRDGLLRREVCDPEPREHAFDALGQVPCLLDGVEVGGYAVALLDAGEGVQFGAAAEGIRHRRRLVEGYVLRQVRNAARARDASVRRLPATGQQVEQRRLARAVGTDESGADGREAEMEAGEKRCAVGEDVPQVGTGEVWLHGLSG